MVLSRIRAGDQEAFAALVADTWDDLVEHLAWLLGSREAAQDAAQEAMIRIWERREEWHEGSARGLVFRIGRNAALDARRREKVRLRWRSAQVKEPSPPPEGPEEEMRWSEYEGRLRSALDALPPARREVVELVRLRGLTHREVAELLGLSQQTVANRMTLALAELRTILADLLPELMTHPQPPAEEEAEHG